MRDDRHKWAPAGQNDFPIDIWNATLSIPKIERQTLISGQNVLSQIKQPLIGWPDIAKKESYAVTLRRDRVLLINGPEKSDGWNTKQNQAISNASNAFAVFDLSGEAALSLLKRGTELSLEISSRSAARRLFGLEAILYRFADKQTYRIHVHAAHRETLIENFKTVRSFCAQDR